MESLRKGHKNHSQKCRPLNAINTLLNQPFLDVLTKQNDDSPFLGLMQRLPYVRDEFTRLLLQPRRREVKEKTPKDDT